MSSRIYVSSNKRTCVRVSDITSMFLTNNDFADRYRMSEEKLNMEKDRGLNTIDIILSNGNTLRLFCFTPRKARLEFNKLLKMMEE